MAALLPEPTFGAIRYRNGSAVRMVFVPLAILTLLAFVPNNEPNVRDLKLIVLPFVALGLVLFYLYPVIRPTDLVTTTPEGIELRAFIGTRRIFIAWRDVKAVVLWTRQAGPKKHSFIGIERHPSAPPLPHESKQGRFARSVNAGSFSAGVSLALLNTSVVSGKIDVEALSRLIASASPDVPVLDTRVQMMLDQLQ
jgi:hypothetical protein